MTSLRGRPREVEVSQLHQSCSTTRNVAEHPLGRTVHSRFVLPVCATVLCLVGPLCGPISRAAVLAAGAVSDSRAASGQSEPTPPLQFALEPGPVENVPPASYYPHFLSGGYTETWSYLFRFPSGHTIISRLTITNRGAGDGRGAAFAIIVDPTGRVVQVVNSRPQPRWTRILREDGVELGVAGHEWVLRPPSHRVRMQSGEGRFEIEATSLTDVYHPGRLHYSSDEFYDLTILAPRLSASGTVQLTGEAPVELRDGRGFAFHSYANRGEQDQAVSWLQFHTFDSEIEVSLWELTAPEKHDYQRVGIALLFEDGRLVEYRAGYDREYRDLQADAESPHYPVPRSLTFSDEDDQTAMHGEVTLVPIHRVELVDLINSRFVRFFVRRVMEPVMYEFSGDYHLRVRLEGQERQISGTGIASLQIVDDPPIGF